VCYDGLMNAPSITTAEPVRVSRACVTQGCERSGVYTVALVDGTEDYACGICAYLYRIVGDAMRRT
jgi:hypothetical protein